MEHLFTFAGYLLAGIAGINLFQNKKKAISYFALAIAAMAIGTFVFGTK